MPRIQFDYPSAQKWYDENDEATSVFDVCTDCNSLPSDTLMEECGGAYNGEPDPTEEEKKTMTHLDIGVGNPSLAEGNKGILCECCKTELKWHKNY